MRYHNITKADMLNGDGLRVVLWLAGCSHHCQACQNPITWDANDGLIFDEEAKREVFAELEKSWCSGLTLSGGDPLFLGNRKAIRDLVMNVKQLYKDKTIWSYTGYTWEELIAQREVDKNLDDILNCIYVLLEGKFVMKLHDDRLHYVGSSNQRIIDVKKSIEEGKVVLYIDNSNIGDSDKATVVQCAVNS